MYNQYGQPMNYQSNSMIKPSGGFGGKPINYFGPPMRQPLPPTQNIGGGTDIQGVTGPPLMHTQPFNPIGNPMPTPIQPPQYSDNSGGFNPVSAGLPLGQNPMDQFQNPMQQQRWMLLRQLGIPY